MNVSLFLDISSFNLAHWLFAYNYWALSWRVELIKRQMNPDTYNCRLNAANIVVSLISVLIPAIDWVLYNHPELYKAFVIVAISENGCLAVSCAILVWGFQKLIKTVQSGNNHFVNKAMISWHIAAYFFIIFFNVVAIFTWHTPSSYVVTTYC
jgi:hypothetical protein